MNVHVCTTRRPCVKCASIRTCDTRHLRDKVVSLRALLYLFFSLSTLPPFSTFVILWQCLALREKANQSDLLALKFLHRRHYRVKVADTPTCLSNLGTLQLPLVLLPPCQPVVYHKHRHLTCWTAIIKASVDIIFVIYN